MSRSTKSGSDKPRLPIHSLSEKEQAIKLARMIIDKQHLRMALTPTESVLVARQLLKAYGLDES